jgi:hypothetical protein
MSTRERFRVPFCSLSCKFTHVLSRHAHNSFVATAVKEAVPRTRAACIPGKAQWEILQMKVTAPSCVHWLEAEASQGWQRDRREEWPGNCWPLQFWWSSSSSWLQEPLLPCITEQHDELKATEGTKATFPLMQPVRGWSWHWKSQRACGRLLVSDSLCN